MLTRRERLLRCYHHQELDRPAVFSRSFFPPDDPSYDRLKAYLAAHTECKVNWMGFPASDHAWEITREPVDDQWQREVRVLHTPAGPLRCSTLLSLCGHPGMHETFLVNDAEDARKYLSLPPNLPTVCDASGFFALEATIGDSGIVDVSLGLNPGGFVAELCGSVNLAMLSISDRPVLHALCERRMQVLLRQIELLAGARVGPCYSILGQEYLVPPLHGPEDFADFNSRYDKLIIDRIHEAGGRVHVHSHGSIRRVFHGFLEAGVDVLHPFEAPPQGDITAAEAKNLARGRMCLEGNIQIHRMYEVGPDAIRDETRELITTVFDDHRGLIVSPTASPYIRGQGEICFPQYQAMVETVLAGGS